MEIILGWATSGILKLLVAHLYLTNDPKAIFSVIKPFWALIMHLPVNSAVEGQDKTS